MNINCDDIISEGRYKNTVFCDNELSCEWFYKDVHLSTAECPVRFELAVLQFYCNALAGLFPFTELVLIKLESFTDFFDLPKTAIKKYIRNWVNLPYLFIYFLFISTLH